MARSAREVSRIRVNENRYLSKLWSNNDFTYTYQGHFHGCYHETGLKRLLRFVVAARSNSVRRHTVSANKATEVSQIVEQLENEQAIKMERTGNL